MPADVIDYRIVGDDLQGVIVTLDPGDVLFNGSIGRTDLPGGDYATLMGSIQSQFLSLPDSTVVHSGHGPDTTIGVERLTNPFLTGAFPLG